jgi:hypothetical protein
MVANLRGNAVSSVAPEVGQVIAWDGFQWAPANNAANAAFQAVCDANVEVGSVVYVSGQIDQTPVVSASDNRSIVGFPARGVVVTKLSQTTCTVQTSGTVLLPNLVAGSTYWVGTEGSLVNVVPTPSGSTVYVQVVGFAATSTKLVLQTSLSNVTVLSP